MQADAKFPFDNFRFGDLGTKDMRLVAAPNHFLDEIDGLRRTAAGGRIKRFVGQKRDAERGFGLAHARTLSNFGQASNQNQRGFDGEKF